MFQTIGYVDVAPDAGNRGGLAFFSRGWSLKKGGNELPLWESVPLISSQI
jgi:hypothetical protein